MYIETERLILRRWDKNDAKTFAEINSHTDVMALLGRGTMSVQEACENIRKFEDHFDEYGFGFWAVEKKRRGTNRPLWIKESFMGRSPTYPLYRNCLATGKGIMGVWIYGGRLENGNFPTLRLFFVQCSINCA